MIRSVEENLLIKEKHSASQQILDALSLDDVQELINYYLESEEVIEKNTGPKVLFLKPHFPIFQKIKSHIEKNLGPHRIRSIHFFDTKYPHVIHNDDDFNHPMAYKAVVFPLQLNGKGTDSKFVTFNQYYYNGPAKFFNKEQIDKKIFYNVPITCYNEVQYKDDQPIDPKFVKEYLGHLKKDWLEGLSIENVFEWKIGSAIYFDSLRLHCASNFLSKKITSKIGLSVFTVLP